MQREPRDRGRGILAGRPVDRRTILRAAAGAGLGLSLPGVLAGCGKYLTFPPAPLEYAIELTTTPPVVGFPTMIAERAHAGGVEVYLDTTPTVAEFKLDTASRPFINPVNDQYPLAYDLVAFQPATVSGLEPIARSYLERGGKLVTYLTPLAHQTAQITVSPRDLGETLAIHATAWAATRLDGRATAALFVLPEPAFLSTQFLAGIPAAEQAVRATFARHRPDVTFTTVTGPNRAIAALRLDPARRVVLCAIDADALVIAQGLRQGLGSATLYVGGLGSPAPYGAAVLTELRRDGPLRAIAAARPRDLANALVDLPVALLRHHDAYNLQVRPRLITPRSTALREFEADYAVPAGNQAGPVLNPITSTQAIRTTT